MEIEYHPETELYFKRNDVLDFFTQVIANLKQTQSEHSEDVSKIMIDDIAITSVETIEVAIKQLRCYRLPKVED